LSGQIDFHMNLGASPQIANLWTRGISGEELQAAELSQFQQLLHACFIGFESQYYLIGAKSFSSEIYDRSTSQMGYLLQHKQVSDWWDHSRKNFSEGFRGNIDGQKKAQSGLGSLGAGDRI
jgi:hypothetical protein